jgi:ABC-2 type transport system ATP-binding protein
VLVFRGVRKSYAPFSPLGSLLAPGRRRVTVALKGLDLEVRPGEILGLVGLNGAGKTTAIRIACGITLPTAGTVLVDGHDIVREKIEASKHLGWVPEFPNFEPRGQAIDLLEYYAGYHRMSGPETLRWCAEVLSQVGLAGREFDRLETYSQGMKKRFSLASALLCRPTNLLLDELLNGLDPDGIRSVRALLLALRKEGRSILLSSHVLSEVQALADRIAFVHEGAVLGIVTREGLSSAPTRRLRIVLREESPAALSYLGSVGKVAQDGRTYFLTEADVPTDEVNEQLVHRGVRVLELRSETEDLESYFFRLIEGAAS